MTRAPTEAPEPGPIRRVVRDFGHEHAYRYRARERLEIEGSPPWVSIDVTSSATSVSVRGAVDDPSQSGDRVA